MNFERLASSYVARYLGDVSTEIAAHDGDLAACLADQALNTAMLYLRRANILARFGKADGARTDLLRSRAAFAWGLEALDSLPESGRLLMDPRFDLVKAALDRAVHLTWTSIQHQERLPVQGR